MNGPNDLIEVEVGVTSPDHVVGSHAVPGVGCFRTMDDNVVLFKGRRDVVEAYLVRSMGVDAGELEGMTVTVNGIPTGR